MLYSKLPLTIYALMIQLTTGRAAAANVVNGRSKGSEKLLVFCCCPSLSLSLSLISFMIAWTYRGGKMELRHKFFVMIAEAGRTWTDV
jgi:hypothetical protein